MSGAAELAGPLCRCRQEECDMIQDDYEDYVDSELTVFFGALRELVGPIDDDIAEAVAELMFVPGGSDEIAARLEVDPALVRLARGLTRSLVRAIPKTR